MHLPHLQDLNEKLSTTFRPWQRSFQFWVRAADIYTGYKICQVRVKFVKGIEKQEEIWEKQHEVAADKLYSMCYELGGFFLKAAQILGKPDLAPAAWVRRLVTLCDKAPATPFEVVQLVLEKELGRNVAEVFERFDVDPVGSASIAQVQHPGVEELMMTDLRNLQAFAMYLQNTDIKFDLFSITKEMETQVGYEFDFLREAEATERIRLFLHANNKKVPVSVPKVISNMVTRKVLVMEFIDGTPIMNLGSEMAKRGINPGGKMAKVALLDYGQVKNLPDSLRLGYASLIIAIAENNPVKASDSYKELGIQTLSTCADEQRELLKLAQTMFDTKLPPGLTMMSPFSEEASIKKIAVQTFPGELFSVLRTVHLLRGLSVGLGINYSCAELWKPIAEEALYDAGRLEDNGPKVHNRGFLKKIFQRK
ncbi:hypothetical protein CKAN_01254200 [Cinnamomum micranthum f. kanehirae]|uniref:ABC1 atypical kinase-like domain-containing protein n=1 Tax=Cinnamomum micranthum f. kanehirae TaxID=337451 RepID=A0A3S3MPI3_9MAGN|nr:hypothetical protein CKAN_01254200 [Cinnamomum micranthum f. kanehirae]